MLESRPRLSSDDISANIEPMLMKTCTIDVEDTDLSSGLLGF
jgi:hypothetical protein